MFRKIYLIGMLLIAGALVVFFACNDEDVKKSSDTENCELYELQKESFLSTIDYIQKNYPQTEEIEDRLKACKTRSEGCNGDTDPEVDCSQSKTITITLSIAGLGKIYPHLPPIDCGFNITMDVRFCKNVNYNNSVVTFENFHFSSFISPISDDCMDWLMQWMTLPTEEQNEVFRQMCVDYQQAFEEKFMTLWASDPYSEFARCGEEPCEPQFAAVQAKYYKASCSKICLVFEKECEDPYGFLCRKEIPCFKDGCCKKTNIYCLRETTGEVEICNGPIYELIEGCTIPVDHDPCVVQLEDCKDIPRCK